MKITKATRWRVFAGVWIQSLFTSATAFLVYLHYHYVINLVGVVLIFQWLILFICLFIVQLAF